MSGDSPRLLPVRDPARAARTILAVLASAAALGACAADEETDAEAALGTTTIFDVDADLSSPASFYRLPFALDVRRRADGTIDTDGMLGKDDLPIFQSLRREAGRHVGFPLMPTGFFLFSERVAAQDLEATIPASADAVALLVDVDPASPERGRLFPVVLGTPPEDAYTPYALLAIAPRPGFVLAPERRYAFVVKRALGDVAGKKLGVAPALRTLMRGGTPEGERGAALAALWAPLVETLRTIGVDPLEVAAASVFTTGDVVRELAAIGDRVLAAHDAPVGGLRVDPDDGATHERFCELHGTILLPQFQGGRPPFATDGLFRIGADGLPEKLREERVPVVINLPNQPMPAGGFPVAMYFHGSGGLSTQVVDLRATLEGITEWKGRGVAYVLAGQGFATVGMAFPVNPERLPGASETEYLNVANVTAIRDTFRQGVLEQRLLMEALDTLVISSTITASCGRLPPSAGGYKVDTSKLYALGTSMGGMYTNLIGATEPKVKATYPSAAGGYWTYFILDNPVEPMAAELVATLLLGTDVALQWVHPALAAAEMAIETSDPMVFMPRLGRRPLPGHPARPVFQTIGSADEYFPERIYDAATIAYEHQQVAPALWASTQEVLGLVGRSGLVDAPVADNLTSVDGRKYTGVTIQKDGRNGANTHYIISTHEEIRHQYGCFFKTHLDTGVATVVPPGALGSACR